MKHDEQWLEDKIHNGLKFEGKTISVQTEWFPEALATEYAEHQNAALLARVAELEAALLRAHLSLYENDVDWSVLNRGERPIFKHHPLLQEQGS